MEISIKNTLKGSFFEHFGDFFPDDGIFFDQLINALLPKFNGSLVKELPKAHLEREFRNQDFLNFFDLMKTKSFKFTQKLDFVVLSLVL